MKLLFECMAYDIILNNEKYIAAYERGLATIDAKTKEFIVYKKTTLGHCNTLLLCDDTTKLIVFSEVDNMIEFVDIKTLNIIATLKGNIKKKYLRRNISKFGNDVFCLWTHCDFEPGTIITRIDQNNYAEEIVLDLKEELANDFVRTPSTNIWWISEYNPENDYSRIIEVKEKKKQICKEVRGVIDGLAISGEKLYYSLRVPIRKYSVTNWLYAIEDEKPMIFGDYIYKYEFSEKKDMVLYVSKKNIVVYSLKLQRIIDSLEIGFNSYYTIVLQFLNDDKYIAIRNYDKMYVYEIEKS